MSALFNTCQNKVDFCKEYGIEISEEQWPCHYLCDSLIADRGELEGYAVENLINGLHVKILNTVSFRGDWKGIVEQYFRTINLKVKPFLPGFINEDYRERGGKDYRLDGRLNLFQFTQIVIKCVLHNNNSHWLKDYNREEMMIEDDVDNIPFKLWNWGIKNRAGTLRSVPEDIMKLHLMKSDYATITERGIKFKGIYYGCKLGLSERWFEKARNGSSKVKIYYDSRKMNNLYIKTDNVDGFEKCFLLEHQERYTNKSLEEIEYLLEAERLKEKVNNQDVMQSKIELMAEIESIVKEAETSGVNSNNESNRSRIKGIRKNRQIEKMINRTREGFELGKNNNDEIGEVITLNKDRITDNIEENKIDLLRKKQKERLYGKGK
jgi:hypothetical protein